MCILPGPFALKHVILACLRSAFDLFYRRVQPLCKQCLCGVPLVQEDTDKSLGSFTLHVRDVVLHGRMQDTFTLMGSERGTIELVLEWMGVN